MITLNDREVIAAVVNMAINKGAQEDRGTYNRADPTGWHSVSNIILVEIKEFTKMEYCEEMGGEVPIPDVQVRTYDLVIKDITWGVQLQFRFIPRPAGRTLHGPETTFYMDHGEGKIVRHTGDDLTFEAVAAMFKGLFLGDVQMFTDYQEAEKLICSELGICHKCGSELGSVAGYPGETLTMCTNELCGEIVGASFNRSAIE